VEIKKETDKNQRVFSGDSDKRLDRGISDYLIERGIKTPISAFGSQNNGKA